MLRLQHHCDGCHGAVCIVLIDMYLNLHEDTPVNEQCINSLLMHSSSILSTAIQVFSARTK